MNTAAETGRTGERAAVEYLLRAGYEIRDLNWRMGRYELDIVARKEEILHFVEVKTRQKEGLTPPEAAVTRRKFKALTRAATGYLRSSGWNGEVQFDLVAVRIAANGSIEVELIENAMEYNW